MRCGDLPKTCDCVLGRRGRRAHLYADCPGLAQTREPARVVAEVLDPELKVCNTCAEQYQENGGGNRRMSDLLAEADPADVGLLPFGQR